MAGGGAPARARDQEPADADPAARRTSAPPLLAGAAADARRWSTSARRRSSARWSRSRGWWTSSRSLRACPRREPFRPICTRLLDDALALYGACSLTSKFGRSFAASSAEGVGRPGTDSPRRCSISSTTRSRRWSAAAPSTIETRHDAANNLVRVVVADNGPGIPPAERDKLFLPYYSTKQRGSGLGLAIVRRIVAEHGGSIDVDRQPAARHPLRDRVTMLSLCCSTSGSHVLGSCTSR